MGIYGHRFDTLMKINCIESSIDFVEIESGRFENLLESLDILTENNLVIVNEAKLIEFLKEKWKKFIEWIKHIWDLIAQKFTEIKAKILLKKSDKLATKMQKLRDGKRIFYVEVKTKDGVVTWGNIEDDEDFYDEDLDDFEDESALLSEAGDTPKINGGKIELSWFAYASGEDLMGNDLKDAFKKCLGYSLDDLISKLEAFFKSGDGNVMTSALGDNFNDRINSLHFTNDYTAGKDVVDTIYFKVHHDRLFISEGSDDIIRQIQAHNNLIANDIDYINSQKSKVFRLINTMNGIISDFKVDNGEKSDIVKQCQLMQEKLRALHTKLGSIVNELDKAASYYDKSCSKVDVLIKRIEG